MINPRQYQIDGVNKISELYQSGIRKIVRQLHTGGGKCLAKGTPVLMYDGSIKAVEDVQVGDQLMGPDSKPRNVLSLAQGTEMMYKVTPVKGEPYIVNESHILSLRLTGMSSRNHITYNSKKYYSGDIINISILDYLNQNTTFKHVTKGYRVPIDFDYKDVDFDPYILGLWLAEGTHNQPCISNPEKEIIEVFGNYAESIGCNVRIQNDESKCTVTHAVEKESRGRKGGGNNFTNYLRKYNLISNRHIPDVYKINNRSIRLKVLAGLLDGDGHLHHNFYEILTKYEQLNNDILFLCRSLGYAAYSKYTYKENTKTGKGGYYYRISISGDMQEIPCILDRKKAAKRQQIKNVLNVGINVEAVGIDNYYGFTIDGDHLFVLGDFTVTHNTIEFSMLTARFIKKFNSNVVILVNREVLLGQTIKTLNNNFGIKADGIMAGARDSGRRQVKVGMVETGFKRIIKKHDFFGKVGLLIVDEAHYGEFKKMYPYFQGALIVAYTATPLFSSKKDPMKNYFDEIVVGPPITELIESGALVPNETHTIKGVDNKKLEVSSTGDYDNKKMGQNYSSSKHIHNTVKAYEQFCIGEKTIVFNCNIEHSKLVTQAFLDKGYNARHLDGTESKDQVASTLKWYKNTKDAILCNIMKLTAGFDEPSIINVICNYSTLSLTKWLQCLDSETEILTKNGFKKHFEVNDCDIVASFNPENKVIEFAPCFNKFTRPINPGEQMYSIDSPFVDLRVTDGHKLLVRNRTRYFKYKKYQLLESSEVAKIGQTYEIPIAGKSNNLGVDLTDSQLMLLGWWLADGTICKKSKRIRIGQSEGQPKYLHDSIRQCIEESGYKYTINRAKRTGEYSKYPDLLYYSICHGQPKKIDKHLKGCGDMNEYFDKNLSDKLFSINKRQLLILLKGLNYGDGSKNKDAYWNVQSYQIHAGRNKIFADRIQMLCILNDIKCNISSHICRSGYGNNSNNEVYILLIKDRNYASIKGSKEDTPSNPIKISPKKEGELVWCCSTKFETLVTRRNGKVSIIGNCTGRGARPINEQFIIDKQKEYAYPLQIKKFFRIIDMGGNYDLHGDWRDDRDWYDLFHNPEKPRDTSGVAPIKMCSLCEAIIPAQAVICKECGHLHERTTKYDTVKLEFIKVVEAINVAKIVNDTAKSKDWQAYFIMEGVALTMLKRKMDGQEITPDITAMAFEDFQPSIRKWRSLMPQKDGFGNPILENGEPLIGMPMTKNIMEFAWKSWQQKIEKYNKTILKSVGV